MTTGTGQSYTVPAGVASLSVTLYGATGGTNNAGDVSGGDGAEVTASVAVSPGDTLGVDVGGAGQGGVVNAAGGVNGGGDGDFSGGGGGATDITSGGTDLLVAAGGGGAGADQSNSGGGAGCDTFETVAGGAGGNADTAGGTGQSVADGGGTLGGGGGGQPGVVTGPSAGPGGGGTGGSFSGTNSCNGAPSTGLGGSPGSGGTGGSASPFNPGGGGGGGYYGGGSGGNGASDLSGNGGAGGGGGGASYTGGAGVSGATVNDTGNPYGAGQVNGGNGEAMFSYADPVTTGSPSYATAEGQTLTVPASTGLLSSKAGTSGPAGDTVTASAAGTSAQGGTVSVNSDGSFSYTPPSASFTGADSFAYTITDSSADGGGDYTTGTAVIQVQPWPVSVTGTPHPVPGSARGYYLGASGNTWTLKATHPGTAKTIFSGTITVNAGHLSKLTAIQLEHGDTASVNGKTITFQFTDSGDIDGIRFSTPAAASSITFTLDIGGQAATASQIYLGSGQTPASSGSPITFTR